ncbi:hypothetical protein AV903_09715 [Erwinia tracheiphila]|uniref:Uncharacterized protein n=1 Tax=Erwinia tracheiphila TaxID=65700 RepID=A0A345CS44_9GAMM|nr:hypothetical protein AV903_09715 [Erwinia tracheiphila]
MAPAPLPAVSGFVFAEHSPLAFVDKMQTSDWMSLPAATSFRVALAKCSLLWWGVLKFCGTARGYRKQIKVILVAQCHVTHPPFLLLPRWYIRCLFFLA